MPMKARWDTDTCSCCSDGQCCFWCLACICPPIVYTTNLQTMERLKIPSTLFNANTCETLTTGLTYGISYYAGLIGSALAVGPWYYFLRSCILVPVCMQCVTRGDIREGYGINGDRCNDCCCSCCCLSCSLVQESNQLELNHENINNNNSNTEIWELSSSNNHSHNHNINNNASVALTNQMVHR